MYLFVFYEDIYQNARFQLLKFFILSSFQRLLQSKTLQISFSTSFSVDIAKFLNVALSLYIKTKEICFFSIPTEKRMVFRSFRQCT
jgi:hypothetical protein